MRHHYRANTIVETLVASVIIMTAFSCIFILFGNMMRKVSSGKDYLDMKHTRDSVILVVSDYGIYGDMVVLSMEAFEKLQFESEVYFKLQEAEREATLTNERFSSKDILQDIKTILGGDDFV